MAATLHARGYESDRLAACMFRLLAANALCSIATRSESGAVHISTAFYSYSRDPVLHFLSHPDSVHCHNLKGVPQIAVAVFDSRQPWGAPGTAPGRGADRPDLRCPALLFLRA